MLETLSRWMPAAEVQSHTGGPIPPESIFFAPPPIEIGTVLSAQSGLRMGGSAVTQPQPRKIIGLFGLLGLLVGGFLGAGFSHSQGTGIILGGLIGTMAIGWPIYRRESRRNDCTYVGTRGIARFCASGHGRVRSRGEVFLFANATDLQTAFLGRNMGTNFNYQWKNSRGKTLFKLEGGYYGGKKNLDPDAAFHFARAAEEAWCRYYLPYVKSQLQREGCYRFLTRRGLSAGQYAVIGPGYLDIIIGAKTFHNLASDIADIVLHQGLLIIRRKDAQERSMNSFNGAHGIFGLSYGCVSNVRIFLMLLTEVVGVSWRNPSGESRD
jgi:hypothetical protein